MRVVEPVERGLDLGQLAVELVGETLVIGGKAVLGDEAGQAGTNPAIE